MSSPVVVQVEFQARDDDVVLNSGTFTHSLNEDYTQAVNAKFRVRFTIAETNSRNSNLQYTLYYSTDSETTGYVAVPTSAGTVNLVSSGQSITDGDATTQVISTGSFVGGYFDDNGSVAAVGLNNQRTEMEYCLQIDGALISDSAHLWFRVYGSGSPIDTYTQTLDITASKIESTGTLDKTLGALTCAGTGTVADAVITATLDKTLGALTGAGTGTVESVGTIIAQLDFEEGDFSDFDSTTNQTDMGVNASAAMVGSYGLEITLDGSAAATYGSKNYTISTRASRHRFYFDVNSLSMSDGDEHPIYRPRLDGSYSGYTNDTFVYIRYNVDHYEIRINQYDDTGTASYSSYYTISDDPHYIELLKVSETADGNNDGYTTLYIDGALKETISNVDNYNIFQTANLIYIGPSTGLEVTSTGSYYFDDIIVRNDNTEIGPADTGASGTLTQTLGALTAAGTGTVETVISGTLGKTLGVLTASGVAEVDISATLEKTLGALTSTSSVKVDIDATLDVTLGALTSSGAASVDVAATLEQTLGTLTLSGTATGLSVATGTLSVTLGALTGSGTAQAEIQATLSATLGALTGSGIIDVDIDATLEKTLGALVSSGVAGVDIAASLEQTLGALTLDGTGTLQALVYGTLNETLGVLTASGTGEVTSLVTGTLEQTLGALLATGTGEVDISAALAETLGTLTAAGNAVVPVSASANVTLGTLTCNATISTQDITGTLVVTLAALVMVAAGTVKDHKRIGANLGYYKHIRKTQREHIAAYMEKRG